MDVPKEKADSVVPVVNPVGENHGEVVAFVAPAVVSESRKKKRRYIGMAVLLVAVATVLFLNQSFLLGMFSNKSEPEPQVSVRPTAIPTLTSVPFITLADTPPFTNKRTWLISLDKTFYSLGTLPKTGVVGRKDVTGTLYSPVNSGDYLCRYDDAKSVFLEKQIDPTHWVKLCNQQLPTAATNALRCEAYDQDKGLPLYATFYPQEGCDSAGTVSAGTYRMHATIYTRCSVDAAGLGDSCKGIIDQISPQFEVGQ